MLYLAYIALLNETGRHAEALHCLETHVFHPWEGGEGKVALQYKTALFALAEEKMRIGEYREAIELCRRTLSYPANLGEGKLPNVPDNRAHYLIGRCFAALGEREEAEEHLRAATVGSQIPAPVRYYNDQPSDYIYYQGLAFAALGDTAGAKKSFNQLVSFGERHIFDKVEYDYFAVSMPELEVYEDDIQKRSDDYCRLLTRLGQKGLEEISREESI